MSDLGKCLVTFYDEGPVCARDELACKYALGGKLEKNNEPVHFCKKDENILGVMKHA